MADNPTIDTINQTTVSTEHLEESITDSLSSLNKFADQIQDSFKETDNVLKKVTRTVDTFTRKFRPSVKEVEKFAKITEDAKDNLNTFSKAYAKAFYAGNKEQMKAIHTTTDHFMTMRKMTDELKRTGSQIDKVSDEFRKQSDAALKTSQKMAILKKRQDELNASVKKGIILSKKETDELKTNEKELSELNLTYQEAKDNADKAALAGFILTDQYKDQQKQLISNKKTIWELLAAEREQNREIRKMAGGFDAVRAAMEGVAEQKVMDTVKTFFGGAAGEAMIVEGAKKVGKALTMTHDYMVMNSRLALTLGDTTQQGFGRMGAAGVEVTKNIRELNYISAELGYTFEEMDQSANKIRSHIRMDREGRLSADAILGLTREAAYFSRIAGVEMSESIDMINLRIKRYGMTAKEAQANMEDMRTTIIQMTAGNKKNTVAMDDMVKIIESASMASQSYIVDTRIMTTALRAAVDQAEHLGAAQKQAKDVAEGVGKILSQAPDFIQIPAGYSLVNQLMGDPKEFTQDLDDATKKQVMMIHDGLKKGAGRYSAARALMDIVGGTEKGVEATAKRIEQTILRSSEAPELLVRHFGVQNRATAWMIVKMMKEATEYRDKMKSLGKATDFTTAFVQDAATIKMLIEHTKTADAEEIRKLMEKENISKDAAERRLKQEAKNALRLKGIDEDRIKDWENIETEAKRRVDVKEQALKEAAAKGDMAKAEELADYQANRTQELENEKLLYTKELTDAHMRPVETMIKKIRESRKDFAGGDTGEITRTDLQKMGITTGAQLAKYLGADYKANRKKFDQMVAADKITVGELKETRKTALAAKNDAESQAQESSTEIGTVLQGVQKIFARLGWGSPIFEVLNGILVTTTGILTLMAAGDLLKGFSTLKDMLKKTPPTTTTIPKIPTLSPTSTIPSKPVPPPWPTKTANITKAIETLESQLGNAIKEGFTKTKDIVKAGAASTGKFASEVKDASKVVSGLEVLKSSKIVKGAGFLGTGLSIGMYGHDIYKGVEEGQKGKELGKTVGKAGGGLAGSLGGGAAGAWGGAIAGAAIGSVVPVIGTAIGGIVGSIIGGIGGSMLGGKVGEVGGEWIGESIGNLSETSEAGNVAGKMTTASSEMVSSKTAEDVRSKKRMGAFAAVGAPEGNIKEITPSGSAIIEIKNWMNGMSQANKMRSGVKA